MGREWGGSGEGVGREWGGSGEGVGREWGGSGEGVGREWGGEREILRSRIKSCSIENQAEKDAREHRRCYGIAKQCFQPLVCCAVVYLETE